MNVEVIQSESTSLKLVMTQALGKNNFHTSLPSKLNSLDVTVLCRITSANQTHQE